MSTEMGISCQQNEHRAATIIRQVQPIKELSSAAGWYARRGCALIMQLANYTRSSNVHPRVFCCLLFNYTIRSNKTNYSSRETPTVTFFQIKILKNNADELLRFLVSVTATYKSNN